jgi:hypothetical protein
VLKFNTELCLSFKYQVICLIIETFNSYWIETKYRKEVQMDRAGKNLIPQALLLFRNKKKVYFTRKNIFSDLEKKHFS